MVPSLRPMTAPAWSRHPGDQPRSTTFCWIRLYSGTEWRSPADPVRGGYCAEAMLQAFSRPFRGAAGGGLPPGRSQMAIPDISGIYTLCRIISLIQGLFARPDCQPRSAIKGGILRGICA